jgi:alkyldihydroxyacetonephosphate synthase
MTAPTAPIALEGPATGLRQRFPPSVTVDERVVSRLRDTCATVDVDLDRRVEAGRDWWPLTVLWAVDGETPALPEVVVRPTSVAEVSAVLRLCDEERLPVTPAAGRSGVCGGSVPVFGGIALDLCGLTGIVAVDSTSLVVDVAAGTFGVDLERTLRSEHGLTLGHWPQSIDLSTVGGWLACRSAGQYSTRYGKIEDMVAGLDVVLADGRHIATGGRGPREAAGPDLTQLFVGSEGTLGVITRARLRLHPVPAAERRASYVFSGAEGFAAGLEACRNILREGATPAVLRLYDNQETKHTYGIEDGALLIVLDEGNATLVDAVMQVVDRACAQEGAAPADTGLVEQWLAHRNDVSALEAVVRKGIVVDTIEVSARWSALPRIYDEAIAAAGRVEGLFAISAHQSHAYTDGACLYFTFAGQSPSGDADGFYREVWTAVTHAALAHHGALSHHHGVGINRGRYMREALGPAFDALTALKQALDPHGILNPGKLGLPSPFGTVQAP